MGSYKKNMTFFPLLQTKKGGRQPPFRKISFAG